MSNLFTPSVSTLLSLNLNDGSGSQFPRASVFAGGTLITTVDLTHVSLGRYTGVWVPASAVDYDVIFVVYSDAGRTIESLIYTRELERWQPDTLTAGAAPSLIADAVWDELLAGHTAAGSAGEYLARLTAVRVGLIDATSADAEMVRKILRNRLELADGSASNWVLYDDDSTTVLLTWDVADKSGNPIVQPNSAPSRRTRGI